MNKLMLAIAVVAALAFPLEAQSATSATVIENVPFALVCEVSTNATTRLYKNGVQFKDFTVTQQFTLSTNATAVVTNLTISIIVGTQPKGVADYTTTLIYPSVMPTATGLVTNLVESIPSNTCTVNCVPGSPGQLRKL